MTALASPTIDQLNVFAVIVDEGSFSAAARRLNRAQSVVSYTIANLEAQLGVALFERGRRRKLLTEAGRALIGDARRVGLVIDELRARATALAEGIEAEVALVVDVMFPTEHLVAAIQQFAGAFPTVALRLRVEALGTAAQLVLDRVCGLGIAGGLVLPEGLERQPIGIVALVSVAAPCHPLADHQGPLATAALRDHTQLVLTDKSALTEGRDYGVFSMRSWRLGDLGAKLTLLRAGLGWGNMPEPMVRDDLASGALVRLTLREQPALDYPFYLINRYDTPPGPAARWLADRLAADRPTADRK
jgi:DNA-binding transcriptional LysR family regulator